jgi:hypothetical protein
MSSKSLDPIVQQRGDYEAGADPAVASDGPKKADAISQLCKSPFLFTFFFTREKADRN